MTRTCTISLTLSASIYNAVFMRVLLGNHFGHRQYVTSRHGNAIKTLPAELNSHTCSFFELRQRLAGQKTGAFTASYNCQKHGTFVGNATSSLARAFSAHQCVIHLRQSGQTVVLTLMPFTWHSLPNMGSVRAPRYPKHVQQTHCRDATLARTHQIDGNQPPNQRQTDIPEQVPIVTRVWCCIWHVGAGVWFQYMRLVVRINQTVRPSRTCERNNGSSFSGVFPSRAEEINRDLLHRNKHSYPIDNIKL